MAERHEGQVTGRFEDVMPASKTQWADVRPQYQTHWQGRQGMQGERWEEHEPHYRHGWEARNDPRYQGRGWNEVEADVRRDWESRNQATQWSRAGESVRAGWETDIQGAGAVQLREERLVPEKTTVQAGEVGIRKEVVAEQQTVDVPVTREEVVIQRHAVNQPSDRPVGEGETVTVPVREEHATAQKEAVVTEEISVGKRTVQETERVAGTVRREEARVVEEGDATVHGAREQEPPARR